jgi:hypothetical protein
LIMTLGKAQKRKFKTAKENPEEGELDAKL